VFVSFETEGWFDNSTMKQRANIYDASIYEEIKVRVKFELLTNSKRFTPVKCLIHA